MTPRALIGGLAGGLCPQSRREAPSSLPTRPVSGARLGCGGAQPSIRPFAGVGSSPASSRLSQSKVCKSLIFGVRGDRAVVPALSLDPPCGLVTSRLCLPIHRAGTVAGFPHDGDLRCEQRSRHPARRQHPDADEKPGVCLPVLRSRHRGHGVSSPRLR